MALKVDKVKEKKQVQENLMKAMKEQQNNTTSDTVTLLKEAIYKDENKKVETKADADSRNKGGRPKKYSGERSKFTVYVSEDMMEYVDMATKCTFSDNRSDYIIKLILKDMEQNQNKYKSIYHS